MFSLTILLKQYNQTPPPQVASYLYSIYAITSDKLPKLYSESNRNRVMFDYLSLFTKYLSIYNINDSIVEIHENKIRSVKILLNSKISIELGSIIEPVVFNLIEESYYY